MKTLAHLEGLLYVAAAGIGIALAYQIVKGGKSLASGAASVIQAVNPANPANVVNQGANAAFQAVTGNSTDTIGTWLASKLDSATKAADQAVSNIPAPQPLSAAPDFVGDLPLDDSTGFVSNNGGAAVGLLRNMR